MVEVPGAASGLAADALGERLRATINADGSRVSRPYKCADLRILGLDDSVTAEEVVAAVARTGGCSADEVKAGTIRPDFRGMSTITVSCSVAAAKTIVDGRRLLVGWVSAQVKLLDPRPLRCFRCQVWHHAATAVLPGGEPGPGPGATEDGGLPGALLRPGRQGSAPPPPSQRRSPQRPKGPLMRLRLQRLPRPEGDRRVSPLSRRRTGRPAKPQGRNCGPGAEDPGANSGTGPVGTSGGEMPSEADSICGNYLPATESEWQVVGEKKETEGGQSGQKEGPKTAAQRASRCPQDCSSSNNGVHGRFRPRRLFSFKEISQLRRTYYSARAFAQTQVHSLFLHSHNPMGRQADTTGRRSGAGPTFTCFPSSSRKIRK
ncbi:hypothetical protein B5X24_HaOG211847 [Helicoverpa armigera]|nr:hypothetical protein B5X24_HaOG211847 [Helicoverpa armigera]